MLCCHGFLSKGRLALFFPDRGADAGIKRRPVIQYPFLLNRIALRDPHDIKLGAIDFVDQIALVLHVVIIAGSGNFLPRLIGREIGAVRFFSKRLFCISQAAIDPSARRR